MPRLSDEDRDQLKADIRARRGTAKQLADSYGIHEQTVKDHAEKLGVVLPTAAVVDTIAVDKRLERKPAIELESVQPVQGDDSAEAERLTARILDLNELCVELVMENIRLKRALEDAQGEG